MSAKLKHQKMYECFVSIFFLAICGGNMCADRINLGWIKTLQEIEPKILILWPILMDGYITISDWIE